MSSGLYQIRDKNLDTTLDLTRLKPYGDTMNDGKVQTSFTLPVKDDDKGAAAAVMLAQKMGLADPNVALRQKLDENFTFYVVYGSLTHSLNYNEIVVQTVTDETMDMHENDEFLKERLGRKMVVIGASTGTDAHTVGIDAIMNRNGFNGHYGLERYDMIEAYNLGSQVPNEEFLRKAAEVNADVLLVSQTVTQKDVHIQNLTELIELAEAEGVALCAAGVDEALQVAALVVEGRLGHGEGAALHDGPERVVRLREPGEHAQGPGLRKGDVEPLSGAGVTGEAQPGSEGCVAEQGAFLGAGFGGGEDEALAALADAAGQGE